MTRQPGAWERLSSQQRAAVVCVATVDVGLRAWALVDLVKRPAADVKGPKAAWALGLCFVSSAGLLPLTYLHAGRRQPERLGS
jgi:hypothetical protein